MVNAQGLKVDVLVIGSGCAGLMAAVEASRLGASVAVVDKGLLGKSGCSVGAQQIAAVLPEQHPLDNPAVHFADTMAAGKRLNNAKLVQVMVEEAPVIINKLEELGVSFAKSETGGYQMLDMNGHSYPRSLYQADVTGKVMLDALHFAARRLGVTMVEEVMITSLVQEDTRVVGAVGIHPAAQDYISIAAKAVVLATGGGGQLYAVTTNNRQVTGDGLVLALRAGATLVDPEFIQFYPATVAYPSSLAGYIIGMAQFGKLYNRTGERFMARYAPGDMEGAQRDVLATAIYTEILMGNGSPRGGVFLDVTDLEPELYTVFEAEVKTCQVHGIDLRHRHLEVRPAAHYFMGGIRIDEYCRTNVPGLFAAGEAAGGIHGANRLGNNSLLDAVVFGARAGKWAAYYAAGIEGPQAALNGSNGKTLYSTLSDKREIEPMRTSLQQLMWEQVGIIRHEENLRAALRQLAAWQEQLRTCAGNSFHLTGGFAAANCWEVEAMLTLAKVVTEAALHRRESRGAHRRADYPAEDDRNWLRNTFVTLVDDEVVMKTGGNRNEDR